VGQVIEEQSAIIKQTSAINEETTERTGVTQEMSDQVGITLAEALSKVRLTPQLTQIA